MGASGVAAHEAIDQLAHSIGQKVSDPHQAVMMADAMISRIVGRQALTLAFDDVFRMMSGLFIAALIMVPFCKPPSPTGRPASEH